MQKLHLLLQDHLTVSVFYLYVSHKHCGAQGFAVINDFMEKYMKISIKMLLRDMPSVGNILRRKKTK